VFRKTAFDPARLIDTTIAENTSLNGHLKCDGNVRIEGTIDGVVDCVGNVIVGPRAVVRADISGRNVSVQGTVEGNIRGERVEILSTGRVVGDVDVVDLLLDEGGVVRGHVIMRKDQVPPLQPLDLTRSSQSSEGSA